MCCVRRAIARGLVGKAHFQNVSPVPARPPAPAGQGEAPPEPFNLARRGQRRGPEYEHEIRTRWIDDPDRGVPLPYYGFDHLRLCIGHGDQVEGHYTGWLRDRLDGAPRSARTRRVGWQRARRRAPDVADGGARGALSHRLCRRRGLPIPARPKRRSVSCCWPPSPIRTIPSRRRGIISTCMTRRIFRSPTASTIRPRPGRTCRATSGVSTRSARKTPTPTGPFTATRRRRAG